ncbi:MAG: AAA family ATPase [Candidatus Saccharibacteria bacterium]
MSLLLHASTSLQLSAALPAGAGSVIFHGAQGLGKHTMALELGRKRNCAKIAATNCDCHSCHEWRAGNFPDLITIAPTDKASIGVEAVRTLTQRLSLAPYYEHGSRIVIIDQAESLTVAAQNALLKLIEEPPSRTNIILVTTSIEHFLPTVRSRCRNVFFPALSVSQVKQYLIEQGIESLLATDLAELSGGAIGTALGLHADPALFEQRSKLSGRIEKMVSTSLFERLIIAKELAEQKDATAVIIELLHYEIKTNAQGTQLLGLERLRSQLNSNVAPRAAYERFALELGV